MADLRHFLAELVCVYWFSYLNLNILLNWKKRRENLSCFLFELYQAITLGYLLILCFSFVISPKHGILKSNSSIDANKFSPRYNEDKLKTRSFWSGIRWYSFTWDIISSFTICSCFSIIAAAVFPSFAWCIFQVPNKAKLTTHDDLYYKGKVLI